MANRTDIEALAKHVREVHGPNTNCGRVAFEMLEMLRDMRDVYMMLDGIPAVDAAKEIASRYKEAARG